MLPVKSASLLPFHLTSLHILSRKLKIILEIAFAMPDHNVVNSTVVTVSNEEVEFDVVNTNERRDTHTHRHTHTETSQCHSAKYRQS